MHFKSTILLSALIFSMPQWLEPHQPFKNRLYALYGSLNGKAILIPLQSGQSTFILNFSMPQWLKISYMPFMVP
jgi:hypothetical protein